MVRWMTDGNRNCARYTYPDARHRFWSTESGAPRLCSHDRDGEAVFAEGFDQLPLECIEAAVEVEHHLRHERRAPADIVAKVRHGPGEQADEIETAALAEFFARDELADEIELCLLGEGGCFI